MKAIFSLLFACIVGATFGQDTIEFPYNPDSNGDGLIGVDDLLGMLSEFGEPWTLPDPDLWATGTVTNLLEFESDLIEFSASLAEFEAVLDSTAGALAFLQDSLSLITTFNTYAQTNSRCWISINDENYNTPHWHYDITNSCGSVVVKMQYGQTWSDPEYRGKIRLPQEGLFEGQRIFVRMIADYSDAAPQPIEQFVDGNWQHLTTLVEDNGSGAANFDSPLSNKTFIWNGESWDVQTGGIYISHSAD